jgi:hypothetical protein
MMKQRILLVMTALVCLCLLLQLSPSPLENTRLSWINWQSLTGRNNFYFKKRQWLADIRTIAAGVRFLYESRTAGPANLLDVVNAPHLPTLRPEISTNLTGMERT